MEWWTKLKRVMGVPEDEFIEEEMQSAAYEEGNKREQFFSDRYGESSFDTNTESGGFSYSSAPKSEPRKEVKRETRKAGCDEKYVNVSARTQLQVVLVKPEDFQEAAQIADHLINRKTVLLNLEGADREMVRRMIDFLRGVTYALNGTLKRVANGTFIVTPYDVNIIGDVLDELRMDRVVF